MNNNIKVIIISGKGHTGKDTTSNIIKEYAKTKNLKTISLGFSSYIKMYVKKITNWNGLDETKPRTLLQNLGSEIRKSISPTFFIDRIIADIKVLSKYTDIITITDARLPEELDIIKKVYPNTYKFHIIRPGYISNLNENEKNHITENALNNYQDFDYIIYNDGSLDDLKVKVDNILKNII